MILKAAAVPACHEMNNRTRLFRLAFHGCPALAFRHLLVQVSSNVLAGVQVRSYLQQPVWPDLCHCSSILLAGQHKLMVHNPPWRALQRTCKAEDNEAT